MNPMLSTHSLLTLLALVSIASIISPMHYFALRWFENKYPIHSNVFNWLVTVFPLSFIFIQFPSNEIIATYFSALSFGVLGGFFHRKSSNNSLGFLAALGLISASAFWTLLYTLWVFISPALLSQYSSLMSLERTYYAHTIYIIIMAQSLTPPFLMWAWKTFRLRPGIDKPFDS